MISRELAKKIRYIQILTNRSVNESLAGEYRSAFKGVGMEFEEVREYAPGDDIRSIDWNVTARSGRPFVKRFREERELTVLFLVDLSASGWFGSEEQRKNELAAELCALLGFSAVKANDKTGLVLFTDRVECFLPPQKGTSQATRILHQVLEHIPESRGTSLQTALEYVGRAVPRRSILFLISDFQDQGYETQLRMAALKHDVIALHLYDGRETELPDAGLLQMTDPETGESVLVDTASATVRQRYCRMAEVRQENLHRSLRSMNVDCIDIRTGEDYVRKLASFFRRRTGL